MIHDPTVIRIVKWVDHFENNRTKELIYMTWVPIPNKMDGDGYTELLDHPNGAAHFGAWIALVEIASKCKPRGTLLRAIPQEGAVIPHSPAEGIPTIPQEGAKGLFAPHTSASLARISRLPRVIFEETLPRLKQIGWIEYIPLFQSVIGIPQEGAGIPQEGASSRARSASRPPPERNGTERNGTEERKASAPAKNGNGSHAVWKRDPTFPPFQESYIATGKALTDYDWAEAWHEWRPLDIEQRTAAMAGIAARIEAGLCAEPEFVMLPKNYLKKREWTRAIAKRKSASRDELEAYWNS